MKREGVWARLFVPGLYYYLLALAFFVVVFGIIPFSIFAHSGEEWGFAFQQLLSAPALGLVLFVGLALVLRLVAALHVVSATIMAVALFCLGTFLLLTHVYAPIQIGQLDGSKIQSVEPMLYTLIEFALLAAMVLVFFLLRRGRGLTIAAFFSGLLILAGFGYGIALFSSDREIAAHAGAPAEKIAAQHDPVTTTGRSAIEGNVYHIVLDTMQTDAFLLALRRNAAKSEDFDGFTIFENNLANYLLTVPSSASYLTGTLFTGGDYNTWVRQARSKGLFPALSDWGYQISAYVPFNSWESSNYIDHFHYDLDVYAEEVGVGSASFYDLIQVWLASLAPNWLTNEALPVAATLRDRIFPLLTGTRPPLSYADGAHPYASMLILQRLRREEASRPPRGRYIYTHAILPHHPFVLDGDCRYLGVRGGKRAYLDQAECAMELVGEFLTELKRLNRYGPATILVHADTGKGISGIGSTGDERRRGGSRTLGKPDSQLIHSLNALLMIKRPHAEGPLQISKTPTQLVDLLPTVLDILEIEPTYEMHGRSVYGPEPDIPRQPRFGLDPNKKFGSNFVYVRLEDPLDLEHSRLTVLGPADDPRLWSPEALEVMKGERRAIAPEQLDGRE